MDDCAKQNEKTEGKARKDTTKVSDRATKSGKSARKKDNSATKVEEDDQKAYKRLREMCNIERT